MTRSACDRACPTWTRVRPTAHRLRGPPLYPSPGGRPAGRGARARAVGEVGPGDLGRIHPDHAGRASSGATAAHRLVQGPRDAARPAARSAPFEERDPRALPDPGALRGKPRRGPRRLPRVAGKGAPAAYGRGSRPSRRAAPGSEPPAPGPAPGARPCRPRQGVAAGGEAGRPRRARSLTRHAGRGPRRSPAFPFHAVHLADRLFATRSGASVRTPLEASLQIRAEALAAAHAARAGPEAGVAVLVADHHDAMAVRVWVGSPDYLSNRRLGAVDMVRAIRSPGSTLKPFIYGLAFDWALAHPDTRGDGCAPALRKLCARQLRPPLPGPGDDGGGVAVVAQHPRRGGDGSVGAASVHPCPGGRRGPGFLPAGERPGLAVALGGVGLTLETLVTLYGALGSDGRVRPLRLAPDADSARPRRLLDADTARLVAAILEDAPQPRGVAPARLLADPLALRGQDGYLVRLPRRLGRRGRRAIRGRVWIGRVDGTPRPGRVGRDDALPLLRAVFGLLPRDPNRELSRPVRTLSEPAPGPSGGLSAASSPLVRKCPIWCWTSPRRRRPGPLSWRAFPAIAAERQGRGRTHSLAGDGPAPRRNALASRRPGAATITALDGLGRSASATVWVE